MSSEFFFENIIHLDQFKIIVNRESLSIYHQLIPKCMATWNLARAVEAAEMKLKTMEGVSDEMMTLLPSTLLELYEMYSLAKVQQ